MAVMAVQRGLYKKSERVTHTVFVRLICPPFGGSKKNLPGFRPISRPPGQHRKGSFYSNSRPAAHKSPSGNVLFNDALNTFYLRLYGVSHVVKDHSDSEREETCCHHIGYYFWLAVRVILYPSSHRQDNTYYSLCYTSCGALAGARNSISGSTMKDRSDDPSHYDWMLLPRSYISLLDSVTWQINYLALRLVGTTIKWLHHSDSVLLRGHGVRGHWINPSW